MHRLGIFNGLHLKQCSEDFLVLNFGKAGRHYYNIVRGIQHSEVEPNRTRKSIATERTFSENITSEIFMLEKLSQIATELEKRLFANKTKGKTITLKIKYSDFTQHTKSKTVDHFIRLKSEIFPIVEKLILLEKPKESVRLLGISVSNLDNAEQKSINAQLKFDF